MARTVSTSNAGTRGRNRERWRSHVLALQRGELNQREYCQAHALSYASFARWRRIILHERTSQMHPAFVPVRVEA